MQYRFIRSVMVDGETFAAGRVISDGEIPAGCLESLRFVGHVIEHHEPPPVAPKAIPPASAPAAMKSAAKK